MAKINHNNVFETIDKVIENAKSKKAIHLYAEDYTLKGDAVIINKQKLWHFATTGYLGLEQDERLKMAAADAIHRYGTQFPLSKTYISHPLYAELEEKVEAIYRHPVIICKNSTLAHIAVIPQAVSNEDAVILDHQVHWSVQNACQNLKVRGVPVYMIRHNNMEQLEEYLKKLGNKYRKIWYMADGIYSMYGDFCPTESLKILLKKYPRLHLYFDDVHGVSWIGERGSGFIKSHWNKIPPQMILISTLSKTFGASGAVIMCGDEQLHRQVKNFGGPLTFSAQLEPASVAAAIAAADIHLNDEIYRHQEKLQNKINLLRTLLQERKFPLISSGETPVFYIGTGLPDTAYHLVRSLQQEGFFVNPGIYPAVPLRNAGLRITVSNHNDDLQIKELVAALEHHLPSALERTNNSLEKIYKAFGKNTQRTILPEKTNNLLKIDTFDTIEKIDREIWNRYLGQYNALDYDGMRFVEQYFSKLDIKNPNRMVFRYYSVTDPQGKVLALTHTSTSLWKEDMLAPVTVSQKIEEIRLKNPLFLTDSAVSTGSTFTEGVHFYIDENHKDYKDIVQLLFRYLENEYEQSQAGKLVLRDFNLDTFLSKDIIDNGYLPIEMPESAVFKNFNWETTDEFENTLSKRSKRHFKQEILPYLGTFEMEVKKSLSSELLIQAHKFYLNVKRNNKAINNFEYDLSLLEAMNTDENWEFLLLKDKEKQTLLGVLFCYKNKSNASYNPVLIGMENLNENRLTVYRQLLMQTIVQAKSKGYKQIFFGLSAIFEKRKLGCDTLKRQAFVHFSDNYMTDILQNFE